MPENKQPTKCVYIYICVYETNGRLNMNQLMMREKGKKLEYVCDVCVCVCIWLKITENNGKPLEQ